MATAEKINDLSSPLTLTAYTVDQLVQSDDGTFVPSSASTKRSKKRIISTIAPKLALQNQGSTESDLKVLLAKLEKMIASSNDPDLTTLLRELSDAIQAFDAGNTSEAKSDLKAFADSLAKLLDQLPADTDPDLKAFLETIPQQIKAELDQIPQDVTPTQEDKDWFASVMKMMSLMLSMLESISNNQASNSQNQTTFLDKLREAAKIGGDRVTEEIYKQCKAIEDQKNASFWQNLANIFVMAIMTVVTCVFLGPAAAVLTAALFVLQSTGVMDQLDKAIDKAFENSDNADIKKFAVKMGIVLAISLIAGGISGLADGALASVTRTAAEGVEEGVEADAEEAAAEATSKMSRWDIQKGAMVSNMKNFAMQSFFMINPTMDLLNATINGDDKNKDKKEAVEIISTIMNIAIMIVSMSLLAKSGSPCTSLLADNLSNAAARSDSIWIKGLQMMAKTSRNPWILGVMTGFFTSFGMYWGIQGANAKYREADAIENQGPMNGSYSVLRQTISRCNSWIQQTSKTAQTQLKNAENMDFQSFAMQGRYIAEIFA